MSNKALEELVSGFTSRANAKTLSYKTRVGTLNIDPTDLSGNLEELRRMSRSHWKHYVGDITSREED